MAKILIIDDDGIVRDALNVFLTRDGHQVTSASDGLNGVQAFKADIPDLVVLDRNLPLKSGSGVFEEIRGISRAVPIIVLTGYDAPEEAEIYLRHGAAAFLSKGDGLSNVLIEINRLLGIPERPAAAVPARKLPASRESKGLILVAEDDDAMRNVIKRSFAAAGYTVLEAGDGLTAERLARENNPDIILLDIFMPGKTGIEVLEALSREMPEIGIMMISGNADEDIARECLSKGAFDYVPKPPNLQSLENVVRTRLLIQKGRL